MLTDETLKRRIHEANVSVHQTEAQYYEQLHPEVYSRHEQKRITACLKIVDTLVEENNRNVLDVGAGTGNLTGKLLHLGYKVTANDISPEMCAILKRKFSRYIVNGKLTVVNAPIEDLVFDVAKFDLIVGYSVLHHLPDYSTALSGLSDLLKNGGVIYIDHEASPYYWQTEANSLARLTKDLYFHSNPIINTLYFQIVGLKIPVIDYTLSDYWHKKEHAINHQIIAEVFKQEGFEYAKRTDYYQNSTWIPNPLTFAYRLLCKPEMSFWIAKKKSANSLRR